MANNQNTAGSGGTRTALLLGGVVVVLAILAWMFLGGDGNVASNVDTGAETTAPAEDTASETTGGTEGGAAATDDVIDSQTGTTTTGN